MRGRIAGVSAAAPFVALFTAPFMRLFTAPFVRLFAALAPVLFVGLLAAGCAPTAPPPGCHDGIDNDLDGKTDWPDDPGCTSPFDETEADPGECGDGIDNDGDGLTDWPSDPGCASPTGATESEPTGRRKALCADGRDNDGDGKTDYPADPGCFSPHDDDEADACPAGAGCPACANGRDDDGDGKTDWPDDPGCASAAGDDETDPLGDGCGPTVPVDDITVAREAAGDVTERGYSALMGQCGGSGGERGYRFRVPPGPAVDLVTTTVDPSTTLDTVVYVRRDCRVPSSELACNDDAASDTKASTAVVHGATPGIYWIVVDPFGPASLGHYRLRVSTNPPQGAACDPAVKDTCAPGLLCRAAAAGLPPTCEKAVCSDGRDNDGDGKTDYPADPGCTSATDVDEGDDCPKGASCPQCGNGKDDDGDGKTDWPDDPDCTAASDEVEVAECVPGLPLEAMDFSGVSGALDRTKPSYAAGSCVWSSLSMEHVYLFQNDKPYAALVFSTENADSPANTVIYVRTPRCGVPTDEVACSDMGPQGDVGARAVVPMPTPGPYYVFVDGAGDDPKRAGPYRVTVEAQQLPGSPCTPGDARFTCAEGYLCKGPDGGETCQKANCSNGVDDDGDGKTDFPDDPGCFNTSDDDETDGAIPPSCADGIDDDFDGKTDYPADPGCASASDGRELDLCRGGEPYVLFAASQSNPLPAGLGGWSKGSCAPTMPDPGPAPEDVWGLALTREVKRLRVSTDWEDTGIDTILYVRRGACDDAGTEVACNDDAAPGTRASTVTLDDPPRGSYYVVVDGKPTGGAWNGGWYRLSVEGEIAVGKPCTPGDAQMKCESGGTCKSPGGGAPEVCMTAACADHADDDGDGKTDFPFDPGCDSPSDDSEADPVPAPACANGKDDDGDGKTDWPADPDCAFAADRAESGDCPPLVPLMSLDGTGHASGTTAGDSHMEPLCASGAAPETAVVFTVPGRLKFLRGTTAGSNFDTVLSLRWGTCALAYKGCGHDGEVAADVCCNDDAAFIDLRYSDLFLLDRDAGTYYWIVDGLAAAGDFKLQVTGELEAGERCDPAQSSFIACPAAESCKPAPGDPVFRCRL